MSKVKCKDFDVGKLSISRDSQSNKHTYKVLYDGQVLRLSTPKLKCRNGATKSDSYTFLDLLCGGIIGGILETIDEHIIKYVTENSEEILGKKRSRDKVEDIFKDSVRGSTKNPYVRVRMTESGVKVYDKQRRELPLNELDEHVKPNDVVQALLRLECVRAAPGTVKCNWYIDQLKLQKIVSDCLISDDESDDDSDEDSDDETGRSKFGERVSNLTSDFDDY